MGWRADRGLPAAKAWCIRGPASRLEGLRWRGDDTYLHGEAGASNGWEEGRAKLSFDPDTLSTFCSLHRLFPIPDLCNLF